MKYARALTFLSIALLTTAGNAQNFTRTSVSAGSVAAIGASGAWEGLGGSALRATLAYLFNDADVTPPNAFKFSAGSNGPLGKTLSGFDKIGPDYFASSHGASAVAHPAGSRAPVYYTVDWTSSIFTALNSTGTVDSGTFDPFDVTYGDVSGLAGPAGGPVSLYFQSSLRQSGYAGTTSLIGGATRASDYGYSLYVTDPNDNRTNILSLSFSTATGLDVSFNAASGLELFLLGGGADDAGATPDDRIGGGTAILSQGGAEALISPYFTSGGSLVSDLNFGIRREVSISPGGSAGDRLFAWHVDSSNHVGPVPEPASLLVLGLGALGLRRRRRNRG